MKSPRKRRSKRSKDARMSRNKKAAIVSATYYSDCYVRGISAEVAKKATKDSQNRYKKWWLQQFGDYSKQNFGDACAVPRYNPTNQIDDSKAKKVSTQEQEKSEKKKRLGSSVIELENSIFIPNEQDEIVLDIDSPSYYAVTDNGWEMGGIYREHNLSSRPTDTATTLSSQPEQHYSTTEPDTTASNFKALENAHRISSTNKRAKRESNILVVSEIESSSDEIESPVDNSTNDINVKIQSINTKRINNEKKQSNDVKVSPHNHTSLSPTTKHSSFYHEASRAWYSSFANMDDTVNKKISPSHYDVRTCPNVQNIKKALIEDLSSTGGDVTSKRFLASLEHLRTVFCGTKWDARDPLGINFKDTPIHTEGLWLTLSRPHFQECLGRNEEKEYMYTLGRMSFDMFYPTNLVCSIQGVFNQVEVVDMKDRDFVRGVPQALRKELKRGRNVLRTYNIVSAFTVEPSLPQFEESSPNHKIHRPLHGVMKTYGYALPDPLTRNRFSIWFSSGRLEVNDDNNDNTEWKNTFGGTAPNRQLQKRAWILAAKFLLGATVPDKIEPDGSMSFEFSRPIGGHGITFVDVIYLDENLRIIQGHRGSLFVFTKIQSYDQKDSSGL